MPTYAERYNFEEVEKDGGKFIRDTLGLCNAEEVASVLQADILKIGTKDVLAKHLLNALKLIERQNMFVIIYNKHIYKSERTVKLISL